MSFVATAQGCATTQPGQTLKIRAEGNSVHLFDAESGRRIATQAISAPS